MDDDSFGSPGQSQQVVISNEQDVKQAIGDIKEVGLVCDVVSQFEKEYCSGKKKMNSWDLVSLESDTTS